MHQLLKYSLLILPLHLNVIFAAFRPPRCITNLINAPKSSSIPPLIDTTEHNVPRPHEGVTNKKNRRRSQRGYHLPEDGEMAGPLPGETRPLIPIPEDRAVESRDTTNHEHGTFTHPVVYSIPPQTGGTWSRTRKSSRPMFLMPSASLRRLLDTVRPSTNQIRFYVLLLALYFITTIMILCGAGVGMYQAILWCFAALGPKAFVENWGHFLSSCLTVGLTLGMFGLSVVLAAWIIKKIWLEHFESVFLNLDADTEKVYVWQRCQKLIREHIRYSYAARTDHLGFPIYRPT